LHKQHEKTKIFRKFRQDKKKEKIINDDKIESLCLTNKIEKYEKIQKMIEEYDKKLGVEEKINNNENQRKKQVIFYKENSLGK